MTRYLSLAEFCGKHAYMVRSPASSDRRTHESEGPMHDCVIAILRQGQHVLMCHRRPDLEWYSDVWDFPGGHVEATENRQQALARELDEELGVAIDEPRREPDEVVELVEESTRLSIWFIHYDGPVDNRAPDEHDDIRWMTIEQAGGLRLADPAYIPLIERALQT